MAAVRTFEDLEVWKKAHALVLEIYQLTKRFPDEEKFALVSQIRRSAVSISANIAEGGKKSQKDFVRFLEIAQGSLEETKYHLRLGRDLLYLSEESYQKSTNMAAELGRMLFGLIRSLKERSISNS